MFFNLNVIKNKASTFIARMGFIGILCIILMGSTEAAFIVSGKYYFTNLLVLCWLAKYSEVGVNNGKNIVNN